MAFADEITVAALDRDPYPIYARLRRESPVAWVPAANVWFVVRWRDVEQVGKNPEVFAAEVPTSPIDRSLGKPTILTCDGPSHKELRRGIDRKYKPSAVRDYVEALVRPIAREFLDTFRSRGHAELMGEYFEPVSTMARMVTDGLSGIGMVIIRKPFAKIVCLNFIVSL